MYNNSVKDRVNLKYINRRNLVFNFDLDYAMDLLSASVREGEINLIYSLFTVCITKSRSF
ncbi:MAG: hypothetical protein CM15mV42_1070 [uncultured marine virus]|nr:MAG: hypothetical protein CM15mV42_1070 [uncultured marine virus]